MALTPEEIAVRKSRTLAQAQGWQSMPTQIAANQVSNKLRARVTDIFDQIYEIHHRGNLSTQSDCGYFFDHLWAEIVEEPIRDMPTRTKDLRDWYKELLDNGDAPDFYRLVDEAFRAMRAGAAHYRQNQTTISNGYGRAREALVRILDQTMAPFRMHSEGFLYPIVDDLTAETILAAIDSTAKVGGGVKVHFREALAALANGDFPKSANDSWDALESCVTQMGGDKKSFAEALKILTNSKKIPALIGESWNKILAYVNDTPGIRHPLKKGEQVNIDEAGAIYLLAACGAAITYLRARAK